MKLAYRSLKFIKYKGSDKEIISKIVPIKKSSEFHARGAHTISAACSSVARSHRNLLSVLRANDWQYFVTLTFGHDDRLDDNSCRKLFTKWQKVIREKFPSMYYVAVPEYHLRGGLHYHIAVGGVSADDLQLSYSGRVLHHGAAWKEEDFFEGGFEVDFSTGEGMRIYNVDSWEIGFSTATEVRDTTAVARYISKYLTKNSIDPRFFNKRRFHCSQNIRKPAVFTSILPVRSLETDMVPKVLKCPTAYSCGRIGLKKYEVYNDSFFDDVMSFGSLPVSDGDLPFD